MCVFDAATVHAATRPGVQSRHTHTQSHETIFTSNDAVVVFKPRPPPHSSPPLSSRTYVCASAGECSFSERSLTHSTTIARVARAYVCVDARFGAQRMRMRSGFVRPHVTLRGWWRGSIGSLRVSCTLPAVCGRSCEEDAGGTYTCTHAETSTYYTSIAACVFV